MRIKDILLESDIFFKVISGKLADAGTYDEAELVANYYKKIGIKKMTHLWSKLNTIREPEVVVPQTRNSVASAEFRTYLHPAPDGPYGTIRIRTIIKVYEVEVVVEYFNSSYREYFNTRDPHIDELMIKFVEGTECFKEAQESDNAN